MYKTLQQLFLIFVLGGLSAASAQTAAIDNTVAVPQGGAQSGSALASLHGHITDPSGAMISGAQVTVLTAAGVKVRSASADATGTFAINGIAPGSYVVQATYNGFAPFQSQAIALSAGQSKRIDIAMAIEVAQQSVEVTDDAPTVNVEAGGNISAVVLKGKDLDALSDDPDELSNELSALAGPSAGPNGGQIYIDGFSGGQLPPKSSIREIRINQNPFSADSDRLGYGRIEIFTKPGTDKLHGQFFIQGNDKAFNTGNPFSKTIPSYYSYQFNGTLNGSLNKSTSFYVSAEQRNTENVNTWSIPDAVLYDSASNSYVDNFNYGVSKLNLRIRDNVSARLDKQFGDKNTLTVRYGFWLEREHDDLSSGSLTSATTHEANTDHTVQASDTIVINDHFVNETRFQYERQNENHYPNSTARAINVAGDFTGGGYAGQTSLDHATRLELQNISTLSHGAHAIKFGTRLRDTRDALWTNAGFNGAFSFKSAADYKNMANGLLGGNSFNTLPTPLSAGYTTGQNSVLANVFDAALFVQDDWKVNNRFTLSGGIRWESQNHIADHSDWAPRVSLAYALDGNGKDKKAKTVFRAGYGFFYDRLGSGSLRTIDQANVQNVWVLNNPTCNTTATSLDEIDLTSCSNNGGTPARVQYEVAPGYQAPNSEQLGMSLERQLFPGFNGVLTYLHTFGVHQSITRNANQAEGGTPQDSSGNYIYQYFPEGVFKQNQMILSMNGKLGKNFTMMGSYTYNTADSTNSASDAYDLSRDYGSAAFARRNMLFLMGNYSAPWGIRLNPFMVAQSGGFYNITLANDALNQLGNQRPSWATDADCATNTAQYVKTSFGCFNTQPGINDARIPVNMGKGPAAFALNLRVSRGFGVGPKAASTSANSGDAGGPPPGGPGGGRGGPGGGPGGGLGPGGLGGGGRPPAGMFGGAASNRKYSLNFSVQAMNLFNNIDYGTPSGVITPTATGNGYYGPGDQFGHSTNLAGMIFSTGSAARRVFGQVIFSF